MFNVNDKVVILDTMFGSFADSKDTPLCGQQGKILSKLWEGCYKVSLESGDCVQVMEWEIRKITKL